MRKFLIFLALCCGGSTGTKARFSEETNYMNINLSEKCGAQVKLGFGAAIVSLNRTSSSTCRLRLMTKPGYGLAAFVEQLDLSCQASESIHFETRVPGYWKPTKVFSDPLCGHFHATTAPNASSAVNPRRFFNESTNTLDILYKGGSHLSSVTIVVTPTRPECAGLEGLYLPCGKGGYCVARGLACDGRINCMQSAADLAYDEKLAECRRNDRKVDREMGESLSPTFFLYNLETSRHRERAVEVCAVLYVTTESMCE